MQETGETREKACQKAESGGGSDADATAQKADDVRFFLVFLAEIMEENYVSAYFKAREMYLADQSLWACLLNEKS